jgi:superfamily II DNA or RNA helicase
MINSLLEPQKEHAKVLLDSIYLNGYAIDKSDTGTGKTYVACAIAKQIDSPVVVICPKVVIPTWHKILKQFGVNGSLVINYEKLVRGNTEWMKFDKKKYLKRKNWESLGIELNFPKNSLVIFDEVHKCRGFNSINSDLLIACANFKYKILMCSATLVTTVLETKALGYVTQLHNGFNFTKFCQSKGADFNRFGGISIDMSTPKALRGMLEIHEDLFVTQKCASRMTVDMFDGIFPENHIVAESYDMGSNTEKINAIYAQMQMELDRLDERASNYSSHVFAIMMEARRKTELLKIPSLIEQVEDWYEEGISPVVFLNFTDSIQALESRLINNGKIKSSIAKIVGGQSDTQRQTDIDNFNLDIKRVMLVNMMAGNAGVNLHDLNGKFPRASILIPSFSAVNLLQALGRIARAGGLTKCYQRIVFTAGSIEEHACNRVQARLDNLSALNDGDLKSGIRLFSV